MQSRLSRPGQKEGGTKEKTTITLCGGKTPVDSQGKKKMQMKKKNMHWGFPET